MAITQSDFSIMKERAYAGQAADTSPQVNDSKTVEEGAKFVYGQIAVASTAGDSFCANFDGSQTYFEGLVARYFRKAHATFVNNGGYNAGAEPSAATQFLNPDTVDLSIEGGWYIEAKEAITKKGPVAVNNAGEFVEAAEGTYVISGASYEETGAAGDIIKIRLTGGREIKLIEPAAPAA